MSMEMNIRDQAYVTVTKKGERWLRNGHPWVYESDIDSIIGEYSNGDIVTVLSPKGKYIGSGLMSDYSKIRVRLISREHNLVYDEGFWKRRIEHAWNYRKTVMKDQLSCCRIIFGESDFFPGLTVDRFNDILVTQTLTYGMEELKKTIFPLLLEVLREDGQDIKGIYERNDVAIRDLEELPAGKKGLGQKQSLRKTA